MYADGRQVLNLTCQCLVQLTNLHRYQQPHPGARRRPRDVDALISGAGRKSRAITLLGDLIAISDSESSHGLQPTSFASFSSRSSLRDSSTSASRCSSSKTACVSPFSIAISSCSCSELRCCSRLARSARTEELSDNTKVSHVGALGRSWRGDPTGRRGTYFLQKRSADLGEWRYSARSICSILPAGSHAPTSTPSTTAGSALPARRREPRCRHTPAPGSAQSNLSLPPRRPARRVATAILRPDREQHREASLPPTFGALDIDRISCRASPQGRSYEL